MQNKEAYNKILDETIYLNCKYNATWTIKCSKRSKLSFSDFLYKNLNKKIYRDKISLKCYLIITVIKQKKIICKVPIKLTKKTWRLSKILTWTKYLVQSRKSVLYSSPGGASAGARVSTPGGQKTSSTAEAREHRWTLDNDLTYTSGIIITYSFGFLLAWPLARAEL